ncbi:uncharacterized protein APUU_30857A [Aspergillus puulaauensis]|uniref:Uncharacterized protein n=1 Tax=Aspergillus puulaauensis TaxID=1220207 RepID=A0A7R8ALD8_9EURO|nr:uncharacterized protein APUU_30857A [Aspergillus puulaauensis]BCS22632.1 hypothetical protein APUU_30857A [Aspergillus puulaauensis]
MSRTSVSSERIEEFAQELLPLDHRASNDDTQRNEDSEPESESEHSRPPSIQHAKQKPSTAQKIGAY